MRGVFWICSECMAPPAKYGQLIFTEQCAFQSAARDLLEKQAWIQRVVVLATICWHSCRPWALNGPERLVLPAGSQRDSLAGTRAPNRLPKIARIYSFPECCIVAAEILRCSSRVLG